MRAYRFARPTLQVRAGLKAGVNADWAEQGSCFPTLAAKTKARRGWGTQFSPSFRPVFTQFLTSFRPDFTQFLTQFSPSF
jgi:hypothetical protein